jgi:glycosyltransferase involved in cell wall biosynthesis
MDMPAQSDLHIIVPVYNEAENFPSLWTQLQSSIKSKYEVFVVYDFDQDTTVPVVRALIESGVTNLQLIKNEVKRGVVGAIVSGFMQVRSGAILVVMADLSDDLTKVDEMLALYESGFDLVAGSRYMKGGGIIGGPPLKQFLSRMAGTSLHYMRGIPTHDSTNAFKLYDAKMIHSFDIESSQGFEINLEITVKAFINGYNICQLPTVWRDRTAGQSRFRLWQWLPYYLRWYFYAFQPKKSKH